MQDKPAKEDFCPRCNAAVWRAQVCGFRVVADCTPVDIAAEIECFYKKRYTFGVSRWRPSFYLDLRYGHRFEKSYEYVLAAHECFSLQSAWGHPNYWNEPKPTSEPIF